MARLPIQDLKSLDKFMEQTRDAYVELPTHLRPMVAQVYAHLALNCKQTTLKQEPVE